MHKRTDYRACPAKIKPNTLLNARTYRLYKSGFAPGNRNMKKFLPLFFFFLAVFAPFQKAGAQISYGPDSPPQVEKKKNLPDGWHDTFKSALEAARKNNKPILLFVARQNDESCETLLNETLCGKEKCLEAKAYAEILKITVNEYAELVSDEETPGFDEKNIAKRLGRSRLPHLELISPINPETTLVIQNPTKLKVKDLHKTIRNYQNRMHELYVMKREKK